MLSGWLMWNWLMMRERSRRAAWRCGHVALGLLVTLQGGFSHPSIAEFGMDSSSILPRSINYLVQ